ncbi:MAG: mannose-6-phosphate isomerase, class I, partial [Actinomycetota bacterium]|nr:mannose-6-phosphate isomerase, class I [Actinomycetota bacterium]
FRPTAEILRVLQGLDLPVTRRMHDDLAADPGFAGIVRLVEDLLTEGQPADVIHDVVAQCRRLVDENIDIKRAYTTVVDIAEDHPDDVGLLVSLLLNRLTLQPGEAAFLADGIIHAHMRGLCVEVMAASDNVLRGGLTSKFVNPPELVRSLDAGMSRLARVTPELLGTSTELFSPNVEEFALAVAQCSTGQSEGVELPDSEHRIVVCTGGEVEVVNGSGEMLVLKRGESMYAGDADGTLTIHGLGEVAQAFLPSSNLRGRLIDLV